MNIKYLLVLLLLFNSAFAGPLLAAELAALSPSTVEVAAAVQPVKPVKGKKAKAKKKPKGGLQANRFRKFFWWFLGVFFVAGGFSGLGWGLWYFVGFLFSIAGGSLVWGILLGLFAIILLIVWMIYGWSLDIKFSVLLGVLAFWGIGLYGIAMLISGVAIAAAALWIIGLILFLVGMAAAILLAHVYDNNTRHETMPWALGISITLTLLAFLIGGLLAQIMAFWLPVLILMGLLLIFGLVAMFSSQS